MNTVIMDGTVLARQKQEYLAHRIKAFTEGSDIVPRLAVIMVGNNPASELYVKKKVAACKKVGIEAVVLRPFGEHIPEMRDLSDRLSVEKHLTEAIVRCNRDQRTHGVMVQLPITPLNKIAVYDAIDPAKDVDCFTPKNNGLLLQGRQPLHPCTPYGIVELLQEYDVPLHGARVAIISRSDLIGKPLSLLMMQEGVDATVSVCHDATPPEVLHYTTWHADIVVVAVGKPNFLTTGMVRSGVAVVDVGINRVDGKTVGDVVPEMNGHAGWLSPVPGGCGPMTISNLLRNVFYACRAQHEGRQRG